MLLWKFVAGVDVGMKFYDSAAWIIGLAPEGPSWVSANVTINE
jgi:hypothetical protein